MAAKVTNGATWTINGADTIVTGGNGVDLIDLRTYKNGTGGALVTHGYTIVAGNGSDTVYGTNFADIIWGDSSGNSSTQDNGADTLNGAAGNDEIHGGNGADLIAGDLGADVLFGDRGGDIFKYNYNADSSALGGAFNIPTGDWIKDFRASEGDKLDFSSLYANGQITGAGAPDELQWSGTTAGVAYGIWYTQSGGNTYVYADTSGDGVADIGIKVSGLVNFVPGNFLGVNQAPVAGDDTNSVLEDAILNGSVAGNDSDPDGDTLSYSSNSPAGFSMLANGSYTFDASNAAYQHLAAGATEDVVVTYTVSDGHGGSDTATLTITVTGVNDLASISGDTTGDVAEDGTQTASGALAVADLDDDEDVFQVADGSDLDGAYGDFTFDETTGAWEFTLDNASVQGLGEGETVQETLTVTSADGTDSETITVTITGDNDAASIAGDDAGAVTEDGTLVASGTLTVDDIDGDDEESFQAATIGGAYGTLVLLADGSWTYTLDNDDPDLDDLDTGESDTDTFTVKSADGTEHVITITVNGANEAPTYTPPPVYTGTGDPNDFDNLGNPASENLSSDSTNGPDTLYGGAGNDTINAGGGNDTIYGGSGDDNIDGNNNNDSLYGGSGNDTIKGSNNDDTIIGGYGADTLTGGNGNDTFRYLSKLDTGDTITDFASGDKIDLAAFAPTAFVGLLASAGAVGPNEVGYMVDSGVTTIYVDTDGVAGADLEIHLSNGYVPTLSDFVL